MEKNDEIELLTMDDEDNTGEIVEEVFNDAIEDKIDDSVSKIIQDKIDTDKKELVERNILSNEYKLVLGYSILAIILLILMIVRKM